MQLAPALLPPPSPAPPTAGTPPLPPEPRWASTPAPLYRKVLSLLIAVGPPVAAVIVVVRAIGEPVPWLNLTLLTAFYFVIAHGVTIGFHRLFTHRSFEARRPLKNSYRIAPNEKMSLRADGSVSPRSRSGARYPGVPGSQRPSSGTSADGIDTGSLTAGLTGWSRTAAAGSAGATAF